jgi:hypothetical protein
MSSQNKSNIKDLIGNDIYKKMFDLFSSTKKGNEFEINFVNPENKYIGQEKYIQLLKYIKHKSKILDSKSMTFDMLDITYSPNPETAYRVTLNGSEIINQYIQKLDLWKSHVIFKSLVRIGRKKKSLDIVLMKKLKTKENIIDITDLNERVKLAFETNYDDEDFKMIDDITHEDLDKITFRLKQRTSIDLLRNNSEFVQVDLTVAKTTRKYSSLNNTVPAYELEIEYGLLEDKSKPSSSAFDLIMNESLIFHKIIQQSNHIITSSKIEEVLKYYKNIANVNQSSTFLDARQPISLEIQYATDILPNKYAVTDKADGDRYFLLIMNREVYFISTNLNVKNSGIKLDTDDYNGTILDGEYIFISRLNRHIYLIFDALFIGSKDIRPEPVFMNRIQLAEDLCNKIFVMKGQKGFKKNIYKPGNSFDLKDIKSFHYKEQVRLMKTLNEDMQFEKSFPLIRTKYFADATGAQPWEIFAFAEDMWKSYTEDSTVACPYMLDGLIFQPLNQPYVTSQRDSKLFEYKWKPPTKNSIDFYIQFEKDKNTGKVLTVYDNSNDDYVRNKPYRICKLYTGRFSNNKESPELFLEDKGAYWAYLFLEDGEARDIEGNIIVDNTVVEFYYDNSEGEDVYVPEKFRWRPLRTRHDKTESVLRYGRKYGNNSEIAFKIWRSIQTPILISDMSDLAKGNFPERNMFLYDKKIESLRLKIGHELIISASKQNVYFQKISNLAKPLRQFHRWIVSNLVYTYCNAQYQQGRKLNIFDLGCGRGADLMKFYYVAAALYVGADIAKDGLYSAVDGAISRYNLLRKKKPNFPKMEFIHADCGTKLTYDEQNRVLGGMSQDNKKLIEKYFMQNTNKFDVINSQFVIHYLLASQTTWDNLKYNLNTILKDDGYLILTHFDAQKVLEYLGKENSMARFYTDEKGKKEKLFEIVKKFDTIDISKPIGPGYAIDLFASWMFEDGTYQTEYLVDYKFLAEDLLKDCDLELVETDLFSNQFNMNREFFSKYQQTMHNPETQKFLANVAMYYDETEINKLCYEYTFLQRYTVFRKRIKPTSINRSMGRAADDDKKGIKKGIKKGSKKENNKEGGGVVEYKVLSPTSYDKDYSFMNSIYYILKSHQIIPKTVKVNQFYKDHGVKMIKDEKLTQKDMKKICTNIIIQHDFSDVSVQNVIDGVTIKLLENDKLKDLVKLPGKNKIMILAKDDGAYNPVYIKYNDTKQALFKPDNNILDEMF